MKSSTIHSDTEGNAVTSDSRNWSTLLQELRKRLGYFSDLPDEKDTRANCEAWGEIVVRAMMRGVSSDGGSTHSANQTRFTEHSFNHVPYCKQHK